MSIHERWVNERHREYYYRLAKKEGYRSRASFKIMQIDDRFNIFKEGISIVDLGASPGGWLQVAKERSGENSKVIGIDLRPIKPIKGVTTIIGDITSNDTIFKLLDILKGKADVVLSDMAPNITGYYSIDHARSIYLGMCAIDICSRILKTNGKFVMKVFMGDMLPSLVRKLKIHFQSVKVHSPDASRPTSSEVYVISKGFLSNMTPSIQYTKQYEEKNEFCQRGNLL